MAGRVGVHSTRRLMRWLSACLARPRLSSPLATIAVVVTAADDDRGTVTVGLVKTQKITG